MSMLLTADIHLDSNPENGYRWGLLPWLAKQCDSYGVKHVCILGDLTSAKDRHNAVLVNKFVQQVECLSRYAKVHIIPGNHDSITPEWPFFRFLEELPNVNFYNKPSYCKISGAACLLLPATKHPEIDWADTQGSFNNTDIRGSFNNYDYIFCHQTFKGIMTETGFPLPGVDPAIFGDTNAKIWSGDIHMPIKIAGTNIEYVGAPYRTDYGDTYIPRVVYVDDRGHPSNLRFPCPNKILIDINQVADLKDPPEEIKPGDQVKIRVTLHRSDYPEWPELKQEIIEFVEDRGWVLHGKPELLSVINDRTSLQSSNDNKHQSPIALAQAWAKQQNLSEETAQIGLEILKEVS